MRPLLVLRADANTPISDVTKAIKFGQAAGFQEFTLASISRNDDTIE